MAANTKEATKEPIPQTDNGQDQEISQQATKDVTQLSEKLLHIPSKDQWQIYNTWRVNVYRSSLLVSYIGKEDGNIITTSNNLKNVLGAVENDVGTEQERATYQFQTFDQSYISRVLTTRKGSQNEGTVPFRFIRGNLKSRNYVIFQNTFSVKPNSLELDELVHNTTIRCTLDELMLPLPHISVPKITTKYKEDIKFENDVD